MTLDDAAARAQAEDGVPGEVVPAGELRGPAGRVEQHDRRRALEAQARGRSATGSSDGARAKRA